MSAAPGDHELLRAKPRLCQGPLFRAQSWAQVGRKLSDQWMMHTGMKFWLQHVCGVAFSRRLPEPLQSRYNTALQVGPLSPLGPSRAVGIFSGPSKQCHYCIIITTTTQCFKNPWYRKVQAVLVSNWNCSDLLRKWDGRGLMLPLHLRATSETLLFWSLIKLFHFISAGCFFMPSPDWGPITSIWRNVNLTWALSIGEVFTKYSDKLCYLRVLGLNSLWTQFLSYWMPIAALRWLTSLGWWEIRREGIPPWRSLVTRTKRVPFQKETELCEGVWGVRGNPDKKKIPTDHFPVHNTLQKGREDTCLQGRVLRSSEQLSLSRFLPLPHIIPTDWPGWPVVLRPVWITGWSHLNSIPWGTWVLTAPWNSWVWWTLEQTK